MLNQLVSEKFNLLFSIGSCGYSFGMVLIPTAADFLMRSYGWRGAMLILGGLMANIIPCLVAIQMPQKNDKLDNTDPRDLQMARGVDDTSTDELKSEDDNLVTIPVESASPVGADMVPLLQTSRACHERETDSSTSGASTTHPYEVNPSLHGIKKFCKNSASGFQNSAFFQDPWINFVLLASLVNDVTYTGWHTFLIPDVIQRGGGINKIVLITLFAAAGNLSGRILVGALAHRSVNITGLFMLCCGVNIFALPCYAFFTRTYLMLVMTFLSAMAIAGKTIVTALACRERATPEQFPMVYGVYNVCQGIGDFLGGYIAGTCRGLPFSYISLRKCFFFNVVSLNMKIISFLSLFLIHRTASHYPPPPPRAHLTKNN